MIKCPYCGKEAVLKDPTFIYGKHSNYSKVWVCSDYPKCNAYVSCVKGTDKPLGTLATPRLRTLRKEVHKYINKDINNKNNIYRALATVLHKDMSECHVGLFTIKDCQRAIHYFKGDPVI